MRHPVLWAAVVGVLALNLWLGDRVPVGTFCPLLTVPKAPAAARPADAGPANQPCGSAATC